MKKTYISPAALTVQLGTVHMMAESFKINSTYDPADEKTYVSSSDQVLTKETSDVNLWDNEW